MYQFKDRIDLLLTRRRGIRRHQNADFGFFSATREVVYRFARSPTMWLIVSCLVFLVSVTVAAQGVRGSDQYWYVADLKNLAIGSGLQSNMVFPTVWEHHTFPADWTLPPPIHNIPIVYLASAALHLGLSPYLAWVFTNIVLTLLTATAIYGIGYLMGSRSTGAWATTAFFLFPGTLWWTLNPLAEQSIVCLSSLTALFALVAFRRLILGNVGAGICIGLLVVQRPTLLGLVPTYLAVIFLSQGAMSPRMRSTGVFLATTLAVAAPLTISLSQYPTGSILTLLALGSRAIDPGLGWAAGILAVDVQPSIIDLGLKMAHGFLYSFIPTDVREALLKSFLIFAAILSLTIVGACWRSSREVRAVGILLAGNVTIYVLTSMMFQVNTRYVALIAPLTFVVLAYAVCVPLSVPAAARRWGSVSLIACLASLFGVSLYSAGTYRLDAVTTAPVLRLAEAQIGMFPGDGIVVINGFNAGSPATLLELGYSAVPRPVLVQEPVLKGHCLPTSWIQGLDVRVVLAPPRTERRELLSALCDDNFQLERLDDASGTITLPTGTLAAWRVSILPQST